MHFVAWSPLCRAGNRRSHFDDRAHCAEGLHAHRDSTMQNLIYHCLLAKSKGSKNAALSAATFFAERPSHPLLPTYPLALVREPRGCLPEGMALAPKTTEHALSGATLPSRDMPKDNDQMLIIKKQCSRSRRHQKTIFKESDHFISARTSTYQWKFLPCSAATGMPVKPHKIRIILIYCIEGWVGEVD